MEETKKAIIQDNSKGLTVDSVPSALRFKGKSASAGSAELKIHDVKVRYFVAFFVLYNIFLEYNKNNFHQLQML